MVRPQMSRHWLQHVMALFLVAVVLNYPWEIAQAPLYAGMENRGSVWWHCFIASLGDGLMVWTIFGIGWAASGLFDWYLHPSGRSLGLMLAAGLCVGLVVEWSAIHVLDRWAYTAGMPLIPGLDVGVVPILQMLLLPPLIFRAAGWTNGKDAT